TNAGTVAANFGQLNLNGPVSGAGTLVVNGINGGGGAVGSIFVSGADTRTGQTVINGGTLTIDVNGSISNSSNLILGGALFVNNSAHSSTFGATSIHNGSNGFSDDRADNSKSHPP